MYDQDANEVESESEYEGGGSNRKSSKKKSPPAKKYRDDFPENQNNVQ